MKQMLVVFILIMPEPADIGLNSACLIVNLPELKGREPQIPPGSTLTLAEPLSLAGLGTGHRSGPAFFDASPDRPPQKAPSVPSCCFLPSRQPKAARAGIGAKPLRPGLDELFPGRRTDRLPSIWLILAGRSVVSYSRCRLERVNLAQGAVAAMIGIAASVSTLATGFLFQDIGSFGGFIVIAAVTGAATTLIAQFISETKPSDYRD